MATKIQWRRGTAAAWSSANPVLAAGEPGLETDTKKRKVGDGTTAWNSLAYDIQTPIGPDAWSPGTVAETMDREEAVIATVPITSGTLRFTGGAIVRAGKTATTITVVSGSTAAVTPSNQWVALYRQSDLSLLSVSDDKTTAAWPVQTAKTFTLAAPYVAAADTPVYVGIVIVAATTPTLAGANVPSGVSGLAPILGANTGTTGLTVPGGAPNPAPALSAGSAGVSFYAAIS